MKIVRCFITIVALFLSLFCTTLSYASPPAWEYKTKTINILGDQEVTNKLNKIGKENWELVGCTRNSGSLLCIFKRPLS